MNVFQRIFFILFCICTAFILWKPYQNEQYPYTHSINNQDTTIHSLKHNVVNQEHVMISNDVMSIIINPYGGDIDKVILLKYKNTLQSPIYLHLLNTTPEFIYQAQSGISGKDGPDQINLNHRPYYHVSNHNFRMKLTEKKMSIPFIWSDSLGTKYIKIFTLKSGQYSLDIEHKIINNTNKNLNIAMFGQFKQTIHIPKNIKKNNNSNIFLSSDRGIAYSSDHDKYVKYNLNSVSKQNQILSTVSDGWIAMVQQYFISAWIPISPIINTFYTSVSNQNSIATIGYKSVSINILPYSNYSFQSKLWLGPKIQDNMSFISPTLNFTIDYGMFWWLSQPMFKLLRFFYYLIGNWGYAIILITILIKLIMFPLTKAQYVSMIKMKQLQPKINLIKERYKTDNRKINQEIIALYKHEQVNPLKGFLPLLIQMPIFLALYYMLSNSVELRHAPFIFWIHDLSAQDPYYILPIFMGITMFLLQQISPNTVDNPLQKQIMYITPIVFMIFFLWFPSGLVLYYIINNLMTIIQQKIIHQKLINDNIIKN
ncbi:MAG: membrane protein insertase YidC [Buchnera aphidicola (Eriosoma harunire)]